MKVRTDIKAGQNTFEQKQRQETQQKAKAMIKRVFSKIVKPA